MLKQRAIGTILRGAAAAAMMMTLGIFSNGCSDDDADSPSGGADGLPSGATPTISVTASDAIASSNGDTGTFTISLSATTPVALPVTIALGGDADITSDYTADHATTVTIPANSDSATVTITPADDWPGEGVETVTLTITVPSGYAAGDVTTATVEVFEDFVLPALSMTLKLIPAGTFTMGSPDGTGDTPAESHREDDEVQHEVTISQNFWMASTETTIAQVQAFLLDVTASAASADGASPANTSVAAAYSIADPKEGIVFGGSQSAINDDATFSLTGNRLGTTNDQPMVGISHTASRNFCTWLTERETIAGTIPTGYEFRLPTEAEWEYCCRAGSTTAFGYGDDTTTIGVSYDLLGEYAWYTSNSEGRSHSVGGKAANGWGLHDMHGNVWEWCYDWYGSYPTDAQTDPSGPDTGRYRVIRSGSWHGFGSICRSADRRYNFPLSRSEGWGFRVVLAPVLP